METKTTKGRDKLFDDGYGYILEKTSADGWTQFWVCDRKRSEQCRGRLHSEPTPPYAERRLAHPHSCVKQPDTETAYGKAVQMKFRRALSASQHRRALLGAAHVCGLCGVVLGRPDLVHHVNNVHRVPAALCTKAFATMDDFESWKESLETSHLSQFCKKSQAVKGATTYHYYHCARSGTALPKHTQGEAHGGRPKTTAGRTKKLGFTCTAYITLKQSRHLIEACYCTDHYGHSMDDLATTSHWESVGSVPQEKSKICTAPKQPNTPVGFVPEHFVSVPQRVQMHSTMKTEPYDNPERLPATVNHTSISTLNDCSSNESDLQSRPMSYPITMTAKERELTTQKGKDRLIDDGYSYIKEKVSVDGLTQFWVCDRKRRERCRGRLHSDVAPPYGQRRLAHPHSCVRRAENEQICHQQSQEIDVADELVKEPSEDVPDTRTMQSDETTHLLYWLQDATGGGGDVAFSLTDDEHDTLNRHLRRCRQIVEHSSLNVTHFDQSPTRQVENCMEMGVVEETVEI